MQAKSSLTDSDIKTPHQQHPYINFFFAFLTAFLISVQVYLRNSIFLWFARHILIKKKWSRLFSRDHSFISTIISPCFRLSASTQLGELLRLQFLFVFRRLQSLQLLLPTHPCLPLSLPTSLGRPFHGLTPLPFRFLTSAVSAFFRPPQFWILTTQPLFFLSISSRPCLTVAFPVPVSALASTVSPFSPA